MLNYKQKQVLSYLRSVESATLLELYEHSEYNYYHNYSKHFGQVMAKLVGRGLVERISKGVFRISPHMPTEPIKYDINQTNLFETK